MAGQHFLSRSATAFTAVTISCWAFSFASADSDKDHVKGWVARWDGRVTKGVSFNLAS